MSQDPDWERAGRAVEQRISELKMSYANVARSAQVDTSSLWKVRSGHGGEVSEELRRKVDVAVRWPKGTIDRVATDPDYTAPSAAVTDAERLAELEARIEQLRGEVAEMTAAVKQLLAGGR